MTLLIQHWADAIVIGIVLVLNATVGFVQEYRAENAMQALMGMVAPRATVRRDGDRFEVASETLVPGDIVMLESGDIVPADLRLLDVLNLMINEAVITGESVAVEKRSEPLPAGSEIPLPERRNMAFMGTAVAAGRAKAVVVATGARTQVGEIAEEMRRTKRAETPLQQRMRRFAARLTAAVVCAIAFGIGLWRGEPVPAMFLTAVAIAVSAMPEGLPVVMTIALAVGVRRMARRHAVIRRLPAVETLGSCTVIVADKTGTFEPGEPHLFRMPPRPLREGILSKVLIERTAAVGVLMAACTLCFFIWERSRGADLPYAQAAALTAMVVFQIIHVGNCRSETESVCRRSLFSNPFLLIGSAAALGVHVLAMSAPWTRYLLGLQPLDSATWLAIAVLAIPVVLVVEAHKLLRRRRPE